MPHPYVASHIPQGLHTEHLFRLVDGESFAKRNEGLFPDAQSYLTRTCLTYHSFHYLQLSIASDDDDDNSSSFDVGHNIKDDHEQYYLF